MPHSLTRNLVHCVFSTKGRAALIRDPEVLWSRLRILAKSQNISLLATGGTHDHVHLLIALSPVKTLSKTVQDLKAHSSRWMKEDVRGFSWQEGYGAFGVSESQRETVMHYISLQEEHHHKWTFDQEFLTLVKRESNTIPSIYWADVPGALDYFSFVYPALRLRLRAGLSATPSGLRVSRCAHLPCRDDIQLYQHPA